MSKFLKIGRLAKLSGVSVEALRYYESEGLLTSPERTESGYRLYLPADVQKLNFILHAKKVGFSLQEIKRLLSLRTNKNSHTCEDVKSYTGLKMQEVEAKINDLLKMKLALKGLYDACCGGEGSALNCTILSTLDDPQLFSSGSSHQESIQKPNQKHNNTTSGINND